MSNRRAGGRGLLGGTAFGRVLMVCDKGGIREGGSKGIQALCLRLYPVDQQFSTEDNSLLPHPRTFGNIWRHFDCHDQGNTTGTFWVEAGDVAEYTIGHRTAPITKNFPTSNVNRSTVEKPCMGSVCKDSFILFQVVLKSEYAKGNYWLRIVHKQSYKTDI